MILKQIYKPKKNQIYPRVTTESIGYFEDRGTKINSKKKKKKSSKKKIIDSRYLYAYVPKPTDEEVFFLNITDIEQFYVTDGTAVLFRREFS